MANIFADPINSALGASAAGLTGALSGATWGASELAKLGRTIGGTPGEISGAFIGAATGAMGGLLVGSVIGALARQGAVNYYLGNALGPGQDWSGCCAIDSPDQFDENSE